MDYIFEVSDKTDRKIHLSKERWTHIRKKHPEIENPEFIQETLEKPDKITNIHSDQTIYYFWKYYKNRSESDKFLLVVVKYLNEHGYVLSAYYEDQKVFEFFI